MPDNLTPEQRRKTMQAVKGRDNALERKVSAALHRRGLRFRRCVMSLPGRPDFVFVGARLVVFVDGDFWHGWRFPRWADTLTEYWRLKIQRNRRRDRANFRKLRRAGWKVLRFWSHQIDADLAGVVERVAAALALRLK
jgi:DNA mismatch endonuclease (patch repair protein)